ncbi:MAG: RNA 2',3'-cyclic phosphodiesterase [Firmicutes bacterium]|nr:RNA 2',3'-cyclic phosphodiesterase [Bacillota bacterium]
MRLFIGLQPSVALRQQLAKALAPLTATRAISWVPAENFHFTLAFLGEIEETAIPAIRAAMDCLANFRRFEIELATTIDTFPHWGKPRVLWLGLKEDEKSMNALQRSLAIALKEQGFDLDQRFHPHLTIGRVRRAPASATVKRWQAWRGPVLCDTIGDVILFASQLKPTGAVYSTLHKQEFSV